MSEACNFIKKETLAQVFSYESWEISKNTFFTEHLWATASVFDLSFHSISQNKPSKTAYLNPILRGFVISTGACTETII